MRIGPKGAASMSEKRRAMLLCLCKAARIASWALAVTIRVILTVVFASYEWFGYGAFSVLLAVLILPGVLHGLTLLRLSGRKWFPQAYAALCVALLAIGLVLEWQAAGYAMNALGRSLKGSAWTMSPLWVEAALHLALSGLEGSFRFGKKKAS